MDDNTDLESKIRHQFSQLSKEELWNIADFRPLFKEDVNDEFLKEHSLRQHIASELAGYDDFYRGRTVYPLNFAIPDDPSWCSGNVSNSAYDFLASTHPEIIVYLRWAQYYPPSYIWSRVARYNQWTLLESMMKAARTQGEVIRDWFSINNALLDAAIQKHLELPISYDDLRTQCRDNAD